MGLIRALKQHGFFSVKKRSVTSNSAWNLVGFFIGLLIVFVTVPTYVRYLGIDQFGIYALLIAVTTPLKVLRGGLPQATTKFVAEFESEGEHRKCVNIVSTTLFLNLVIGGIGILFALLSSKWLVGTVFNVPDSLKPQAERAFVLAALLWLLSEIATTFQGVVKGLQDFQKISLVNILRQLVNAIGGITVVLLHPQLTSLLLFNCVVAFVFIFYWYYLARSVFPEIRLWPRLDRYSFRKTLGFSIWLTINTLFGSAADAADRLLLGHFFSTSIIGIFSVAKRFYQAAFNCSSVVINTLLPTLSAYSNTTAESERLMLYYAWRISIFCGWIVSSAFVLGPDFLILWIGNDLGGMAGPPLRILLFTALIEIPSLIVVQYLNATNLPKWATIANIFTSIVTILLMLVLITEHGMVGVAWGGLLGIAATRAPFHLIWIYQKKFKQHFSFQEFVHSLYGILLSVSLGILGGYVIHGLLMNGLGKLFGFSLSLCVSPIVIFVILAASESYIFRKKSEVINLLLEFKKALFSYFKNFRQASP